MVADRITELRLTAVKSYRDGELPISPLTILIGRNGGGEIRDSLDGSRREAGPVRGGIEGCAPIGSDSFELADGESLLDGSSTRLPLVDFAMTGVGSGDAGLLMEMDQYRTKVPSATPIKLWTLDALLSSHA